MHKLSAPVLQQRRGINMQKNDSTQFAAVDLGSNSFHMVVAKLENGQLKVMDRLREQVQLGLGMSDDKLITDDAWARGLSCLATFGQRLRGIPTSNCRVVGTNTLRRAVNGDAFVKEANKVLGHEIEIISGREEARLIYEGVLQNASDPNLPRLVIDIGGGSTELIVGDGLYPTVIESINVGCVSMSQRHFGKGRINASTMRRAANNTLMEFHPVMHKYTQSHWEEVVGCSGTIKAINQVSQHLGYSSGDGFSAQALEQLSAHMQQIGQIDELGFPDLPSRRLQVLPGGVAVLQALFKSLGIAHMQVSDTALREGVIYDLHGSRHHANVQEHTMRQLVKQFNVDAEHADRVQHTADRLQSRAIHQKPLSPIDMQQMKFAAQVFELGWVVAHSQYHKHGHYLLSNSDMRGFGRTEQKLLANLVRYHRRKLPQQLEQLFNDGQQQVLLLLRLAVILNRDRLDEPDPPLDVIFETDRVVLVADDAWLKLNPLTTAELQAECQEWTRLDHLVALNPEEG